MFVPTEPAAGGDGGFDFTLAHCATFAQSALSESHGWQNLEGRAKECYRRMLVLVSMMASANGHNSAKIWSEVMGYVASCQEEETASMRAKEASDSEPFALSGALKRWPDRSQAHASQSSGSAASVQTASDEFKANPYHLAAAARCNDAPPPEPPDKKLKTLLPTAPAPKSPPTPESAYPDLFRMPYGTVSAAHQLMMDSREDASVRNTRSSSPEISLTIPMWSTGGMYVSAQACMCVDAWHASLWNVNPTECSFCGAVFV